MVITNKKFIGGVFILFLFFVFVFYFNNYVSKRDNLMFDYFSDLKIAGKNISVNLATTSTERIRGLSGIKSLEEDSGMLFVFERSGKNYFWMKDMNFSIDIIWLDENMRVIYIQKNATPQSYPESFGPDQNSKYVLEVVSGFSDKNNLKVGDSVFLN